MIVSTSTAENVVVCVPAVVGRALAVVHPKAAKANKPTVAVAAVSYLTY
jgi:hypothetical protein